MGDSSRHKSSTSTIARDPLLHEVVERVRGVGAYGGSTPGEVAFAVSRMDLGDPGSPAEQFGELGDSVEAHARLSAEVGHTWSAIEGFRRASVYHAAAESLGGPRDRGTDGHGAQAATCFGDWLAISGYPHTLADVPGSGQTPAGPMRVTFVRPVEGGRVPVVVVVQGIATSPEFAWLQAGEAALKRGFGVLLYEGPGQIGPTRRQRGRAGTSTSTSDDLRVPSSSGGGQTLQPGTSIEPAYEATLGPVLDWLDTRDDIDGDSIALVGLEVGAHLALVAAAGDPRVSALVAMPGILSLGGWAALSPIGAELAALPASTDRVDLGESTTYAPTTRVRWRLSRWLEAFGCATVGDLRTRLEAFDATSRLDDLICPTLLTVGESEGEALVDQALAIRDGAAGAASVARMPPELGAADHLHVGNLPYAHQVVFDWLSERLQPEAD